MDNTCTSLVPIKDILSLDEKSRLELSLIESNFMKTKNYIWYITPDMILKNLIPQWMINFLHKITSSTYSDKLIELDIDNSNLKLIISKDSVKIESELLKQNINEGTELSSLVKLIKEFNMTTNLNNLEKISQFFQFIPVKFAFDLDEVKGVEYNNSTEYISAMAWFDLENNRLNGISYKNNIIPKHCKIGNIESELIGLKRSLIDNGNSFIGSINLIEALLKSLRGSRSNKPHIHLVNSENDLSRVNYYVDINEHCIEFVLKDYDSLMTIIKHLQEIHQIDESRVTSTFCKLNDFQKAITILYYTGELFIKTKRG